MLLRSDKLAAEKFFRLPFKNINKLALEIFLNEGDNVPSWLQDSPSINNFPRFVNKIFPHCETYIEELERFRIADRIVWITAVLIGPWSFGLHGFSFENPYDYENFKSRWGQDYY